MSNVYGVNYTKFNTPSPENKVESEQHGGRVRWIYDSYEASATASGTVIYMGKLPKGAVVLDSSKVYHDALGSGTNLEVGTVIAGTTDSDAFSAAEATTSAGDIALVEGVDKVMATTTVMSDDADVIVTVANNAITGTIKLSLYYSWK